MVVNSAKGFCSATGVPSRELVIHIDYQAIIEIYDVE